ncbi:hypothetical protein OEZ85_004491 [Tetradesmus obliquus]|uniref:GTP diphosphokinase n=1 Tax=Tetradesmus obliquus TaxID=3088 RepID=A0ABY8ULJ8_TETOB|nr:hypothetical protein OEZ85_004491 [Tetradesmus obliquus]
MMVYNVQLSSSPSSAAWASSPPAKSPSLPIARRLSKSLPLGAQDAAPEVQRRTSNDAVGSRSKFSFSHSFSKPSNTPAASMASGSVTSFAKPPAGPSACAKVQVGFAPSLAVPSDAGAASGLASPGRRATKSSLLSRALLDTPTISSELYGAAAPTQAFSALQVLPMPDATEAVDMAPLLKLQELHSVFRASNVTAAYALAARAHAGQTRKSGESVLAHCCATALILAELGLPEDAVAAGLLHDVLCDTPMQQWQLEQVLPASVVSLVSKVSQLNQLSQAYRDNTHSLEAEAMLDMLTGMDDVTALLIKLADRLHNMRTIGALPRCKQVRMASETLDVFAVLANRLGAWAIKAELEDLSFKTLNPEEYQMVADAVAARAATAAAGAEDGSGSSPGSLASGIDELTAALSAAGLQVVDVSGRVKNVYGVWKKVQKALRGGTRNRGSAAEAAAAVSAAGGLSSGSSSDGEELASSPLSPAAAAAASGIGCASSEQRAAELREAVNRVYDIQALRVVVPHKHDCYAAMRVVQDLWTALPGRLKDYIRQRKANGYQSLHLTVRDGRGQPLEVQIRTPKMHYIAEYGFAAHWRYKERLGRQDLWLDRLVQWKKWVASEKLGIVDRKLRPSGSPGAAGGDAALAGLATRLGLEAGAGGDVSASLPVGEGGSGSTAASEGVPLRSISAGDAVAAELADLMQREAAAAFADVPARSSGAFFSPFADAAAAAGSASAADEKFAARFRMQPISEAEVDQHGASVMISGPRGVAIAQLPARCTVAQLLGSREVLEKLRRTGSGGLSSALRGGSSISSALAAVASSSSCRLAVNGVVVMPSQAEQVVLRSGDQLQLLEEPPLLPLLGLSGEPGLGGLASDMAAEPLQRIGSGGLPSVMADAGESLQLFVPGQREAMEVALQQKLAVGASRVPARASALVS